MLTSDGTWVRKDRVGERGIVSLPSTNAHLTARAKVALYGVASRSPGLRRVRDEYLRWKMLRAIRSLGTTLPASTIRLCDEYAIEVLGDRSYSPQLFLYSTIAGAFKDGWLPHRYYYGVVIPSVNGAYGHIAFLKALVPVVHSTASYPDLAYQVNGFLYDLTYQQIERSHLERMLFETSERIVFKGDFGSQGRGVRVLERGSVEWEVVYRSGNGVFQAYVDQHEFFAEYVRTSVATVRLTTAIDASGSPEVKASYLRLGRQDDTHVRSTSAIRVPVDPSSGRLGPLGYLPSWHSLSAHPDSAIPFTDREIPSFQTCKSTVLALHRQMPLCRIVGWDVIVDAEDRIRVLEWNGAGPYIEFSEATQGPCFKDLGWHELAKSTPTVV